MKKLLMYLAVVVLVVGMSLVAISCTEGEIIVSPEPSTSYDFNYWSAPDGVDGGVFESELQTKKQTVEVVGKVVVGVDEIVVAEELVLIAKVDEFKVIKKQVLVAKVYNFRTVDGLGLSAKVYNGIK